MLKSKGSFIKWNNRNKKHYIEKGYIFTKNGDEFYVKIKDITKGSNTIIEVECDSCNTVLNKRYKEYNKCVQVDGKYYCKKCTNSVLNIKENNHNYNPNLSQEERDNRRNIPKYTDFIKKVIIRDNYTCRCCGKKSDGNMEVHHLNGYDWCKEGRVDEINGIALCKFCHKNFHSIYGYGSNTKEQYEEWVGKLVKNLKFDEELPTARKIYCIEENKVYDSAKILAEEWELKSVSQVYNTCNNSLSYKTIKNKHILWYDKMDSTSIDSILSYKNNSCKQIICLNTKEVFEKIKYATEKYPNTSISGISQCCSKIYKTCGKFNEEKLMWMYYEEYMNKTDYEIKEYIKSCLNNNINKSVKCITTGEEFDSIKCASLKYNIKSSNITMCCQGKYKYAGKINNEKLFWEYI